jgi:GT2 family glycosyltransferase
MLTASVIIPNLDSPHLADIIQALRQQTVKPLEVLIVGRGCYESIQDDGWVRLFSVPYPIPPAHARSVGLAYARGEVCCFLDADCVPVYDWLECLLHQHQQGKKVVGGSIAIGGETFWQRCYNIASLGPLLTTAPAGTRPYMITGNLSIRRNILQKIGGFDLRFPFAAGEDTDLSFRLRRQQYILYFEPAAEVIHRTSWGQPKAIWKHLWIHGYEWPRIQAQHTELIGSSRWQRICNINWRVALLFIPLLTFIDTYKIYAQQPILFWNYWTTCPVVFWARMAWYSGRIAYVKEQPT